MSRKNKHYKKDRTDLIQILSIVGSNLIIMLTIFGISVSLHLSSMGEIRAMESAIRDFHGKLCIIESKDKK